MKARDLLLSALLSALVMGDIWSPERIFLCSGVDMLNVFQAAQEFSSSWWSQGCIPLWNPHCLGGMPWLAGFRNDFYPVQALLLLLVPPTLGLKLSAWFHLTLGWWSMAFCLRRLGRSRWSSWLAGAMYSFSGFRLAQLGAGHLDVLVVTSYAPLLLLATRARRGLLGAACLGLMLSCGFHHFQIVYITLWTLLADSALRRRGRHFISCGDGRQRNLLRAHALEGLRYWALTVPLGVGLGAWLLLPTYSYWTLTTRAQSSVEFAGSFAVQAWAFLTALTPHIFNHPQTSGFWSEWVVWEGHLYLSLAGLLCLLTAPWVLKPRCWVPSAVVMLCTLGLALGPHTPLHQLYYRFLPDPAFGWFRAPGRFLFAVNLLAPELIARVLDRLRCGDRKALRIAFLWTVWVSALLAGFWLLISYQGPFGAWKGALQAVTDAKDWARLGDRDQPQLLKQLWVTLLRNLGGSLFLCLGFLLSLGKVSPSRGEHEGGLPPFAVLRRPRQATVLTLLVLLDLTVCTRGFLRSVPTANVHLPEPVCLQTLSPNVRVAVPLIWRNLYWGRHFSEADGGVAMLDRAQSRCLIMAMGGKDRPDAFAAAYPPLPGQPLFDRMGARFWIAPSGKLPPYFQKIDPIVYENPRSWPRAFLTAAVEYPGSLERAQVQAALSPSQPIVCTLQERLPALTPGESSLRWERFEPNGSELEISTPTRQLLVVTDAPLPGWEARVDGQPQQILEVNGALHRGLVLEPGRHRVIFAYWPPGLTRGLQLSLACSILLLLGLRFTKTK